eukprot:gene26285-47555_t
MGRSHCRRDAGWIDPRQPAPWWCLDQAGETWVIRPLFAWRAARRVPPRQAGNFHLRAQMKVTKAKGLNTSPFGLLASASRLLQQLWPENTLRTTASVSSLRFKHAVSTRLDPVGSSVWLLVPEPLPFAFSRSVVTKWAGVQGLFFGYFFLAPQKKVTRLPGRNPGAVSPKNSRRQVKKSSVQIQRGSSPRPRRNNRHHRRVVGLSRPICAARWPCRLALGGLPPCLLRDTAAAEGEAGV